MTIDEANSLILQKTKSDNKDLVKGTMKSKQFQQICKHILKMAQELEAQS